MGHSRIVTLPATRGWTDVVRLLGLSADVGKVARATLHAAQRALATVADDAGFREAAFLLVNLAVAGTKANPLGHLASVGVDLSGGGSSADLAVALSEAVDRRMDGKGQRTDWGEIARGSLVAAVSDYLSSRGTSLFGSAPENLAAELKPLRKEKEFGALGRKFTASLANKFLRYFLDKTLATDIGAGRSLATLNNLAQFKAALQTHCHEAAGIVEDYFGGWLSKHSYMEQGDISRESAEKFAWYGVEKLRLELAERGRDDGA